MKTTAVPYCVALAASLLSADAVPIEYNPYTTSASAATLSHVNPASGAVFASSANSEERSFEATTTYVEPAFEIPDVPDYVPGAGSVAGEAAATSDLTFGASSSANESVLAPVTRKLDASSSTDIHKLEAFFGAPMEVNAKKLAPRGSFHVMPWPSSYWPIYLDGINYQWDGRSPSAAAKYASAFGLDVDAFTKTVSEATGVLSQASGTSCWSDWDCYRQSASVCAKRKGEYRGFCIPTWYGICHAWTPASILEPEPNCAVEYNGVTFQPMDIKALLSQVYDDSGVGTVFTGARFSGSDAFSTTDQYGRYMDSTRRDLGPGFMHIAATNILSRFNATFVLDVEGGAQVWNQPVYSYEVVAQTEMTPTEGAQRFFWKQRYPFNDAAKSLMYTEMKIVWMVETLEDGGLVKSGKAARYTAQDTYKYLLELDGSGNIIGGEWVDGSKADHPDFLWFPERKPDEATVTEVGLSYKNVQTLLSMATNC